MKFEVRQATVDDLFQLAQLFDLYRQFYGYDSNINNCQEYIENRLANKESIIFIAENNEKKLVGFCQSYPTFCSLEVAPIIIFNDLYTLSEARGLGVATGLLKSTEKYASEAGFVRMELTTAITNNTAQSLYKSLGWEKDNIYWAYSKNVV